MAEATAGSRVLVTGATGYVGSRLVSTLLDDGHVVVAATHSASGLRDFPWGDRVETVHFDVDDDDVVAEAVQGIDALVYLVHSMGSDDFVEQDRAAAERVARAAADAGVERIVYLSGLVPPGELSDHLRSRQQVEQVFLDGAVPATVLRAAMVIGAGSTSYELLRRLSERVPLLTPIPAWMRSSLQPVAIEDVVHLISRALVGPVRERHYDVGGDQVLTYPELLALFADVAGLHRRRFLVPWVPNALVGWACARIAGMDRTEVEALVQSLSHDMVCREDDVRRDLLEPGYRWLPVREALTRSLRPDEGGTSTGERPEGTREDADKQAPAESDPA